MRLSLLSLSVAVASSTRQSLTNAFIPTLFKPSHSNTFASRSISTKAAAILTAPLFLSSTPTTRAMSNTSLQNTSTSSANSDTNNNNNNNNTCMEVDTEYPGTAVTRLKAVHARVAQLATTKPSPLNGPWESIRQKLLWAGGLADLPHAQPGQGYTGHSFNDYNHVDLTTMNDDVSNNTNNGQVAGIAYGNKLGQGIRIASLPELGPGGSWSTCAMGCHYDPPQDVAHLQFRSRIAFKLVWVPNENYDSFVLVDDDGNLLATGTPQRGSGLPLLRERQLNYRIMKGSKYAREADRIAAKEMTE